MQILSNTSVKNVDCAPWLEPLPTSSLSKIAQTGIALSGLHSKNASSDEKTHSKSSNLGAIINSLSNPTTHPLSLLYKNKSWDKISSSSLNTQLFLSWFSKVLFSFVRPITGSKSFCRLYSKLFPFKWAARLGITTLWPLKLTSLSDIPSLVFTKTRPYYVHVIL